MKRMKVTPPSDDISEQRSPTKMRHGGDASGPTGSDPQTSASHPGSSSMALRHHILQLLSTKLSPAHLEARKDRLDILRKCSYYMEVHQDASLTPQSALSHSTILQLIDPLKLQRMKKLANSQVKILLCLLEELYEQILRDRAHLQAVHNPCGSASSVKDDALLRHQVEQLTQYLVDFDTTLPLGPLHAKHTLISNMYSAMVPRIRLFLNVKMPVLFDKSWSEALASYTRLHWYIAGSEQQEAGEQFEVSHRLVQPANADEGSQVGKVTCSAYYVHINNLLPERHYEFTVKRVDTCFLVYSVWNESLVLRTAPACPGSMMGSQ